MHTARICAPRSRPQEPRATLASPSRAGDKFCKAPFGPPSPPSLGTGELLMRFPKAATRRTRERASERTRAKLAELRSGALDYKRIPIEIMKINDVKAPSRLQLIIARKRPVAAADRSTAAPDPRLFSSLPLYCYNIIAISILH